MENTIYDNIGLIALVAGLTFAGWFFWPLIKNIFKGD